MQGIGIQHDEDTGRHRMTSVPQFEFESRTRIVFGAGKLESLGALAGSLNISRALVVSDPGIVQIDWVRPRLPKADRWLTE